MTKPNNLRPNATYSIEPTKKPKSNPIDVSEMCTLFSHKYDMTFFGATPLECEEKLLAHDQKREGKKVITKGSRKYRIK